MRALAIPASCHFRSQYPGAAQDFPDAQDKPGGPNSGAGIRDAGGKSGPAASAPASQVESA